MCTCQVCQRAKPFLTRILLGPFSPNYPSSLTADVEFRNDLYYCTILFVAVVVATQKKNHTNFTFPSTPPPLVLYAFIIQTICDGEEGRLIDSWVAHDGLHGLHGQRTDSCSGFEETGSCSYSSEGSVTDSNCETMNDGPPLVQVHVHDSCFGFCFCSCSFHPY